MQAEPRWLLVQVGHLPSETHSSQCDICRGRCKPVVMTHHPLAGGLGFPKEPHRSFQTSAILCPFMLSTDTSFELYNYFKNTFKISPICRK